MPIKRGDKAPHFSLSDETGTLRSLTEFLGKPIVLYFYPKDDTPGCTAQGCSLRDSYDEFKKNGIVVIGVSYDSPQSHAAFKKKYNLPFLLLSDSERKVAQNYGAYQSIKNYLFPERITILINKNGIITHILEKVDVTTHTEDVLRYLAEQNSDNHAKK